MTNINRDLDVSYKTDDFGRPDDADYHYRIPLNDDRAMRLATWALHEIVHYSDRFVVSWDGFAGDSLSYMGIRTNDRKGHLRGLAEYAHSPRWEDAGVMTDVDRYRQNPSGAGTKVVGSFRASPVDPHAEVTLTFDTVVDLTPTEFEAALEARGDAWDEHVRPAIRWAKDDAVEAYQEAHAERQRECDHDHTIDVSDATGVAHSREAVAFCEDCHAEVDADGSLAY